MRFLPVRMRILRPRAVTRDDLGRHTRRRRRLFAAATGNARPTRVALRNRPVCWGTEYADAIPIQ
jgi:hypothetical protein